MDHEQFLIPLWYNLECTIQCPVLCQLAYLCRQQAICIEARFSEIAAQLEDCPFADAFHSYPLDCIRQLGLYTLANKRSSVSYSVDICDQCSLMKVCGKESFLEFAFNITVHLIFNSSSSQSVGREKY
ncbi:hypothetical protein Tsp_08992 [Trichinella spiralis]|uniref:hypothetical protein n=1 Tax=Trichinella spiralis TaxID=6334 RepID=UPI0001EFC364|nr:hypothetical protein Tsp_08992 [Trichinella spiralis]